MSKFAIRLEGVLGRLFGRPKVAGVVVAKALNFDAPIITHIPGYAWSIDGFMEIWGDPQWNDDEELALPYQGKSLYGVRIDPSRFMSWPFNWSWGEAKGHIGPPRAVYSKSEISEFMRHVKSLDDLVQLAEKMGKPTGQAGEVARDVVKSIRPGLIIPANETYTNNFEVIINEPVKMVRLAGGSVDEIGNNIFNVGEIKRNLTKL